MTHEKQLALCEAALTLEHLLYNAPDSIFISICPQARDPYIHLTEEGFRLIFKENYIISPDDPCEMVAWHNGVKYIALADRRLDK